MAIKSSDYHQQVKFNNIEKLRNMQAQLPAFCGLFFRGISDQISTRTAVGYAYDLRIFFNYVVTFIFDKPDMKVKDLSLDILDQITKLDIESYMEYLSMYVSEENGRSYANDEHGKARKLCAVRRLYNYFYEAELIKTNPASIVHSPKFHEKTIIRLDPAEVATLLDIVEKGSDSESKHQSKYRDKTRIRDLCILTLLLGTGIRVSECVGLNIKDVDFDNGAIKIFRKGGNEALVYFGDEVEEAFWSYIAERNKVIAVSGSEDALFLSMQNKRITVRAVENLVKKYASQVTTLKNITPHKLRSTYGTSLYRETGDIYLVASVLGHKDVNTTKKHYADIDEDQKRSARNIVKLRKE